MFDDILIDPSFPEDNSPNRKPRTGMLTKYMTGEYDLENSFVIGDRLTDMELAHNLGAKGIWLRPEEGAESELAGLRYFMFSRLYHRMIGMKIQPSICLLASVVLSYGVHEGDGYLCGLESGWNRKDIDLYRAWFLRSYVGPDR